MALDAIVGIATILVMAIMFYGPWQWICSDVARQILFEKRDAIFDMAQSGRLSFESRDYRTIRRSLEKTIRFAHELTLPKFIYMIISHKLYENSKPSELTQAIARIENVETRTEVEAHISEALRAVLLMMLLKSPLAALILLLLKLTGRLIPAVFHWVRSRIAQTKELIQSEAEEFDSLQANYS